MNKVVEFLQANPGTVSCNSRSQRKSKMAVHSCSVLKKMENYGSAQTTQKTYTKTCRKIRKLRFLFLLRSMHGFVYMVKQYLKTTWK